MTKSRCHTLARKLGCDLEYTRNRAKHVDIRLPAGLQVAGNPGLNALHHECELSEDIWPGVYEDMRDLEGGMEPLDPRYT
jgi:hypothetical protein